MIKKLHVNRSLAIAALAIFMILPGRGWGQLIQQDFSSSTTVADYINASTPSNGQFNAIGSSGAGTVISINGNALQFVRTATNAGTYSRTSDLSGPPLSLIYRFDLTVSGNTSATTTAATWQVGSAYGTANSTEANASTFSRIGLNLTATNGTFSIRDLTGATNSGTFSGTQTITWVMNNSGNQLTYKAPDGTFETLANDKSDVWIGITRSFNDIAVETASQALTDLKFTFSGGSATVKIDNILINPIPTIPNSNAATNITSTEFQANWAAVAGVTGYRLDVATDAGFTSLVSGYNNLYVSGQATASTNVTGLSASSSYYYRVRAASQYTVGEFASGNSTSQNPTTTAGAATIDGIIAASEYGTHTNGSNQQSSTTGTWYMNWDASNLYIGIAGTNTAEGAVLYLDKNPIIPVNGGSNTDGNLSGNEYDGSNFANLQFRADMVVYFKDGYREYRTADGAGAWSAATPAFGSYASLSGTREIAIPWSALGGQPAAFNWFGHVAYAGGGAYASVPIENPGSSAGTIIGSAATWDRYFTVSTTTTLPFSRNSYTFTSAIDVTGFGAITAYDFTMNSSGRFLSRTGNIAGNWTIGGNLTAGAGTIYLGSGGGSYGTTSISGNLNLLGGTFDMDQTTGAVSVTGNVPISSGATLKLSGTAGGDLNVAGNWLNSGTFTPSSRLVQFNGTSAQTLNGATTFDYLKINNSAGLTLQATSPITVNTNLDLTAGKITLGANNLTMGSAATFSNQSATSYIITNSTGALVRNNVTTTSKPFPVGLAASYIPLAVTNNGTSNNLSLVVTSPPSNAVSDATKIVNLEWNLNSAGSGSNCDIIFNWNTGNQGASYSSSGTGELGNYTSGPNYAITSIGTMAGQTKTVTGIALTSGNNKLVLGNTSAVYAMPPSNDNCAGATALTLDAVAVTGNVTNATLSLAATCAGTADDDVWYSFTTSAAGNYSITVIGSASFDAVVDLRSGACNGTNVACADGSGNGGTEIIISALSASTTYLVRVYSYGSSVPTTTTFTIAVTSPPASLSTNGTSSLAFATNQAVLTNSASQTFNLSGAFLTGAPGNITVLAPNTNFQVSNDNASWGSTATIAFSSSTLASTPVYVRFTPQTTGAKTGNITFSGGGVSTPPTIALTGTGILPIPGVLAASNITNTSFDANWSAVTGASSGYLLDVSTSATFGTPGPATLTEGFETGLPTSYTTGTATLNSGIWSITNVIRGTSGVNSGSYSVQLQSATGSQITSPTIPSGVSDISFWVTSSSAGGAVQVNYSTDGGFSWVPVPGSPFTGLGTSKVQKTIALNNAAATTLIQFYRTAQTIYIDDVSIGYTNTVPSFVTGYNAKPIAGQATVTSNVTISGGLSSNTNYYYRLRATDGTNPSAYSGVTTVITAPAAYTVSGGGAYCAGGTGVTVTLSGSQSEVTYELWKDGVGTATTLPGTGSLLSFNNVIAEGLYTIKGYNGTLTDMTGDATVSVNALPSLPTATATLQPTCSVATGTITITAPTGAGMTYSIDGADYTNTSGEFTLVAEGTYPVTAKSSDGCISPETSVTINAQPLAPAAPTATATLQPTCSVATGTITVTAPIEAGMTYSIDGLDYTNTSGEFTLVAPGLYTVTAKNADGCISDGTDVTISTQPTAPSTPTASVTVQPSCAIPTGTIVISAPTGSEYEYQLDADAFQTSATFTGVTTGGHTVTARLVASPSCISNASGTLTVNALPSAPFADAGPALDLASVGFEYIFSDAIATNGTVLWTQTGGSATGTLSDETTPNPTFLPASTGEAIFTLTVTSETGCGTATDEITLYIFGTNPIIWDGSTNNDWHTASNWTPPIVPVSTTNVSIPVVNVYAFYPTINLPAVCNNITIASGASLIDNGKLAITGKITVNHAAVTKGKWHFVSSPVSGVRFGIFTGNYVQSFTPEAGYVVENTANNFIPAMQGLALWPNTTDFTAPYVGGLDNANPHNFAISNGGSGDNQAWNLVGNPYPSAIDWDASSGWSKAGVVDNAVYIYDGATWRTYVYNAGTGRVPGTRYIAPGQGFFVKASADGTLSMTNDVRVHNPVSFYKKSDESTPNLVRIEVSGNGYTDDALVRFMPEATAEFDGDYDAYKRYGDVAEAAQLYTLGSIPLAINSIPEAGFVPVGIKVGVNGTYTIGATEINDMQYVALEDNETGILTDLSSGSYTFDADAGTYEKRFKLLFSMLGVTETQKVEAAIYSYQKTVHINMKDQTKGDIYIYNIAGQQVASKLSAQGMNEIKLPNAGNYIVRVISKNSTVVRKVYIQQ